MNTELPLPASPSLPLSGEAVSTSSPRTANRLTLSQTFALGAWIKDHEQQAKDDPDTQASAHAALDLGFTVTTANFTAARQALGIEKTKPATPPTIEDRLTELESQIKGLFQQSAMDHTRVTTMRSDIDAKLTSIDQTLGNHRAGFEDLLKRTQALEQRFSYCAEPPPPPSPTGYMIDELAAQKAPQNSSESDSSPATTV